MAGRRARRSDGSAPPAARPAAAGLIHRARVPLGRVGPLLRPPRQARRGDRDGRERGAVHPRDRARRGPAVRLPAHGELVLLAQEPPLPARAAAALAVARGAPLSAPLLVL